ncbi:MAG: hypothetical protein Q9160_003259 [Pyrenula sp. 1 TL-2023]
MAHLQYFTYPGFGEKALEETHYSQAVRIGDIIEVSGQGGWDAPTSAMPTSLAAQISNAFSNVDLALTHAGSRGWAEVYKVRCYVGPPGLDEEVMGLLLTELRKWCPDHRPVLTGVAVAGLWEGMRLELEVKAWVGKGVGGGGEERVGGKEGQGRGGASRD